VSIPEPQEIWKPIKGIKSLAVAGVCV